MNPILITAVNGRETDDKGRVIIADMSDREIAAEILVLMRAMQDMVTHMSQHPMAAAMMPGFLSTR